MENLQSLPEVQRIIAIGKANSEVSYDEINEILPDKILNSEKIDDVFTLLHELGIEVVEEYSKKSVEAPVMPPKEEKPTKKKKETSSISATSEDPIRLYLKEIGKVSLISVYRFIINLFFILNDVHIGEENFFEFVCFVLVERIQLVYLN